MSRTNRPTEQFEIVKWRERFSYAGVPGQKAMLRELYEARRWQLDTLGDAEELAHYVTRQLWPLCTAFRLQTHNYLFLQGDLESENRATFLVVKPPSAWGKPHRVINTCLFEGFSRSKALQLIEEILADRGDEIQFRGYFRLETPHQHGRCPLCG